jgi:hypothetical protein
MLPDEIHVVVIPSQSNLGDTHSAWSAYVYDDQNRLIAEGHSDTHELAELVAIVNIPEGE